MSERKKIIIALATQHKVVCVQEAGDLKNHYSELTSFGQNCSGLAQDSFEDDSLDQQETHTFKNINEFTFHSNNSVPDQSNSKCSTLEQHVDTFENQNYDYNNICAKEKDLFQMQPYSVSKITDETNKVSAKVYFEMKPLSPINEVEYGRRELLFTELQSPSSTKNVYVRQESQTVCTNKSLNETNLTKTYSKEQSTPQNDNTDYFQQYEDDMLEDDSDLDPSYDPQDPEDIRPDKRKRIAKIFQIDTKDIVENDNVQNDDTDLMSNELDTSVEKEVHANDEKDKNNKKKGKKRARTEKEQIDRHLEKYQLLKPCNCKKKCREYFSEERRQDICQSFWRMSFGERRQYLNARIKIGGVKRRKVDSNNKRQYVLTYSLIKEDSFEKDVCKQMFLKTHGLQTNGMITEFKNRHEQSIGLELVKDKRGMSVPPNKKDPTPIRNHIESYNPQISHYKLEHAPNRIYLPPDLSITDMWKNYCEIYEKISYDRYRTEFSLLNIGFDQPNQDECDICGKYKEHKKVCAVLEACDQCASFNRHHESYISARKAYDYDRNQDYSNSIKVYCADMQKVLLLPKLSLKSSVFVSKLVVFNETFASLTKDEENICVLWHEAISGRTAEDVASAYCAIIQRASVEVEHYEFWCDNCSGQNKNWKLFTSFVVIANSNWGPQSITLKYFEPGHSYMRADSVHGNIGKSWKKKSNIYDMNELNELILKTSRKNKTLIMKHDDFYNFKDGARQRKKNDETFPKLNVIKVVQFKKGSRQMFFKKNHNDKEFITTDFLKPKFDLEMPESKIQDRGINPKKIEKIIQDLVPSMPTQKRLFWEKLRVSETSNDLLNNRI